MPNGTVEATCEGSNDPPADLKSIDVVSRGRPLWEMERESILLTGLCSIARCQPAEVQAAIRFARICSHKGNEQRQNDYVERTIKKALTTIDRGR